MAFLPEDVDKGLALVAVAAAAWLAGGAYYGGTLGEPFMLGLLLVGAGFAVTAWTARSRPVPAAAGLALAIVGMVLFLGDGLGSLDRPARLGSHAFMVALALMALGVVLAPPRGLLAFRAGAVVGLLAVLLWVWADVDGGMAWQPGNALAGVGVAWSLARPPVTRG